MKKIILFILALPIAIFAESPPINFAVIGDFGSNTKGEAAVAKKVKEHEPEFVITVGDNNYTQGCWSSIDSNIGKYYSQYIGNYKGKYGNGSEENRFFPTLGNHDWYAKNSCLYHGTLPYLEYFTLPGNGRYYDFVKGPIHFFALDSDPHEPDGATKNSEQHKWLESAIKKSTSPFNIAYFHHASYSSSSHGNDVRMQWNFKELGINLVLSGHDHTYERIVRDGLTYVVNGIGGPHHLTGIHKKTKGSQFFYAKKFGFMMITADSNNLTAHLINEDNDIIDTFLIKAPALINAPNTKQESMMASQPDPS